MDEVEKIKCEAEEFARAHRKEIARELTNRDKYIPDVFPISFFMAGSPGAGKTEYSKNFIDTLEGNRQRKVIRIDGDELRQRIPGYTGKNSYLFNTAVSLMVERIHDYAIDNKQTFVLDGTLSRYAKAMANINRSLSKGRAVFIFYVYQKPEVAWKFTQAREASEGRNIPKEAFIRQFIDSRDTIDRIHKEFEDRILIVLVKKNFETHAVEKIIAISSEGHSIDHYLEKRYSKDDLERLL